MNIKKKAAVYVISERGLLIFAHSDHPEVGFQVPSGTVHEGETAEAAAIRELKEETGLQVPLTLLEPLPIYKHDMRPFREEIQERHPFLLKLSDAMAERWTHWEMHPDTPNSSPVRFEFQWEPMHRDLPKLLSVGQGRPIQSLCKGLIVNPTSRIEYRTLRASVQSEATALRNDLVAAISLLFPDHAEELRGEHLHGETFSSILGHVACLAQLAAGDEQKLRAADELLSAAIECGEYLRNNVPILDSASCIEVANHGYEIPPILASAVELRRACTSLRPEYISAFRLLKQCAFTDTVEGCAGIIVELLQKKLLEATTSYTLSGLPGTIYCDSVASDVRLAETLLHEATYSWLAYAFSALQPQGFSATQYWSPWRHKPRSAYGILQATFVFSLLCQFFDRCRQSKNLVEVDRAYVLSRLKTETAVLHCNLSTFSAALNEIKQSELRTVIAEELNRALNISV